MFLISGIRRGISRITRVVRRSIRTVTGRGRRRRRRRKKKEEGKLN
jgi:hypothetical protein